MCMHTRARAHTHTHKHSLAKNKATKEITKAVETHMHLKFILARVKDSASF